MKLKFYRVKRKELSMEGNRWYCEIIQDHDRKYYANMYIEGKRVKNLPEYVDYNALKEAIYKITGIEILKRKDMIFESFGRKRYALIDASQRFNENGDCRIRLTDAISGKWKPAWGENTD